MNLTRKFIGAVTILTLAISAVSITSAQEAAPAPDPSQGNGVQAQYGKNNFGQFKKRVKDNWSELSFEEKQEKLVEKIDNAIEHLNDRLEKLAENEDMDPEVKEELIALIEEQLNNLPSYRDQILTATSDEELKKITQQMLQDSKKLFQFMQEHKPDKEDLKEKWDNLSFEEKQELILSKLNERRDRISETIEQVEAATTEEELEAIKGIFGPMHGKQGKGHRPGPGNSEFGHNQPEDQPEQ